MIDDGFKKRTPEGYDEISQLAEKEGMAYCPFSMGEDADLIIKQLHGNGKNMFYLGMLTTIFMVDSDHVISLIQSTFKKLPQAILYQNIALFRLGM